MMIACVRPMKHGASHRTPTTPTNARAGPGNHVMSGWDEVFTGYFMSGTKET